MDDLFKTFSNHYREIIVANAMFATMNVIGLEKFVDTAAKNFWPMTYQPMFNGGEEILFPTNKDGRDELASTFRIVAKNYPKFHIDCENCAETQIAIKVY